MKYLFILLLSLNAMAYDAFIKPSELKNLLGNSNLVLLDVSSSTSYNQGHITGALHLDVSKFIKSKEARLAAGFSQKVQKELIKLGISENSHVVIYYRNRAEEQLNSSYLALILTQHGFENISILDGGYMAWVFEYNSIVSAKKSYPLNDGTFKIKYNPSILLLSNYSKKESQKALSTNYRDNFFNDLTLKNDIALEDTFASKLNLSRDEEIIIYDDTIFSASMNWYILYKKLGFKNVKIYEGSFLK